MSNRPRIVVVGAGVSGLTTALELARTGKYDITVVAKHMPGDYDIEYASPWAGANFLPVSQKGTPEEQYDRDTWPVFEKLAREVPEAGVHFQENFEYWNHPKHVNSAVGTWMAELMSPEGPWFSEIVPNYRKLTAAESAPYETGIAFTSTVLNVSLYLPWLASQLLKYGATIRRGIFKHILEAKHAHASGQPADLIVNATGLSAGKLPGVSDGAMYPARAQVVIVRNEPNVMVSTSGPDDDDGSTGGDEILYIMQRAGGGGTILGGCYQARNWSPDVDTALSERIMRRAVRTCPRLTDENSLPRGSDFKPNAGVDSLSVVRHAVGLRPCREGGVRLEVERMDGSAIGEQGDTPVLHNYGHGGFGYQSSYGCAFKAVKLAEKTLG